MPANPKDGEEKVQLPWNPDDLTGIDVAKNEAMTAAYLGYNDNISVHLFNSLYDI